MRYITFVVLLLSLVACDPSKWGKNNGGSSSNGSSNSGSSSSSGRTTPGPIGESWDCGPGLGVCAYTGGQNYCIPNGTFCCGSSGWWAVNSNTVYGTAFNCQRGPSLNWGLYPRNAFFDYAHNASCLDEKYFSCNGVPR